MKSQEQWLLEFCNRLKAERVKQGLTQNMLAIKANTKQDYIAQIERGGRNPSLKMLMKILAALDISADYLIYGAEVNKDGDDINKKVLDEFILFLSRRDDSEIVTYYEIVRLLSKHIDGARAK